MEPILDITQLNLGFRENGSAESSNKLFRDLSLQVPRGIISAIAGGNGSGKTTLFNVISGIQKVDSGELIFNGQAILRLPPFEIARKGIGRLFQGAKVFTNLTILENLMVGHAYGNNEWPFYPLVYADRQKKLEKELTEKAETILTELFGSANALWEKRHQLAGNLSFGQQRLLSLTGLLMQDHVLYLLDEPTAGVNMNYIDQIEQTLLYMSRRQSVSIFLIEHNMQFVRKVASQCFFLDSGKILAEGSVDDVLDNEYVQQTYISGEC